MSVNVFAPIAVADLYDKLSILEIKLERMKDEAQLLNVRGEWLLLNEIAQGLPCNSATTVGDLRTELKSVNQAIWDAENQVRQMAAEGEHGEAFAAVARLTYSNNDRRSAIKKKLNILSGSQIIEEKYHASIVHGLT